MNLYPQKETIRARCVRTTAAATTGIWWVVLIARQQETPPIVFMASNTERLGVSALVA